MAGTRHALAAFVLVAAASSQVQAFGRQLSLLPGMSSSTPGCVVPSHSTWQPSFACPPGCSMVAPARPASVFAVPSAAPPSQLQTGEPPLSRPIETSPPPLLPKMKSADVRENPTGPVVVATRSLAGNASAPGVLPVPKERCRVGFWNLTGRDVTLVVDGKSHALARDRALTLDLNRMFVWQADARGPQSEQVAEDQSTHEVVVR